MSDEIVEALGSKIQFSASWKHFPTDIPIQRRKLVYPVNKLIHIWPGP